LSCGAAVRAGARFCPQCGKLMEAEAAPRAEAAPVEAAREDEGAAPGGAGEAADVQPAAVEEIRLEESWKRWEESVVAHADAAEANAAEVEAPAREQSREAVDGRSTEVVGGEPRGVASGEPGEVRSGESRGVAGEVSAPPSTPPLMRPHSAPPAPSDAGRDGRGDGLVAEGAQVDAGGADTGSVVAGGADGSLARPRAGERGRRAAAVKESLRPRVERVRDASMGVLEDAAEDSGLRFVLIAVALFAVFLFFLFINNLVR
jgi:hypothetical protein